jgi:hypothetical protein
MKIPRKVAPFEEVGQGFGVRWITRKSAVQAAQSLPGDAQIGGQMFFGDALDQSRKLLGQSVEADLGRFLQQGNDSFLQGDITVIGFDPEEMFHRMDLGADFFPAIQAQANHFAILHAIDEKRGR